MYCECGSGLELSRNVGGAAYLALAATVFAFATMCQAFSGFAQGRFPCTEDAMLVFDASGSMSAKGWGYGIPSNELIAQIHDRMPLILPARVYKRWLGTELDPHDLLVPFPQELMAIWPVSTRVNKPENDEPSLLDPAA